jgi:hypothetical protein
MGLTLHDAPDDCWSPTDDRGPVQCTDDKINATMKTTLPSRPLHPSHWSKVIRLFMVHLRRKGNRSSSASALGRRDHPTET